MPNPLRRAILAALLLPLPLPAQLAPGRSAPEVELAHELNTELPIGKLSELRGSAVLLEFWATWCGPCRAQIPHLIETHERYRARGLVVLGVTNEALAKVQPFVEQNQMSYAIGVDPGGAAMRAYGVNGIPHGFLIDKDGNIVWSGHPASLQPADIDKALVGAAPRLGRLDGQLEPVQMLLDQQQKGRALLLLQQLQAGGKLDAAAAGTAARVVELLGREAKAGFAHGLAAAEAGKAYAAALQLQSLAQRFDGSEHGKAAAAQLQLLAGQDQAGQRAVAAARAIVTAQKLFDDKRYDDAWQACAEVAGCGDDEAAAAAAKLKQQIEQGGMRGYDADCMACRLRKKACEQHQKQ